MEENGVSITRHNNEIARNLSNWNRKPLLREIYKGYYQQIARELYRVGEGAIVELGSGIGNIKEVIPDCIRTDLFPNPWINQVESAYQLSFETSTISNLILFDVFHHLQYPGTALDEFSRVLIPGGRVIIFEPYISIFGAFVYGVLHHEPIAYNKTITWRAPPGWNRSQDKYYAAQGNATRIWFTDRYSEELKGWKTIRLKRISGFSYVMSGGYSKPQLYPTSLLRWMRRVDFFLDYLPALFATRILVVLERA